MKAFSLVAIVLSLAATKAFGEQSQQLIPREQLFGAAKYSQVSLSPDGRTLAYLAPNERGIRNVHTRCVTCKHTEIVTFDNKRDISGFQWTGVPGIMLYFQDNDGDENHRLYKVNISNPLEPHIISDRIGVKAVIIGNNPQHSRIIIGLNDENPAFHNVYEFDLLTNALTLIMKNRRFPLTMFLDNDLKIRLVSAEADDGSLIYYQQSPTAAKRHPLTCDPENWVEYLRVESDDKPLTMPLAFTKDNKRIYWQWGPETDLGSLVLHDFGHPEANEILYTATRAQIGTVVLHPTDRSVLAVTEDYHKPEFYVANLTIMDDLQYLVNMIPSAVPTIVSISQDFHTWLVTYLSDDRPYEFYLYRRWQKRAEFLFSTRPELENRNLSRMIGFEFLARDNLPIQAYLTLPISMQLMTVEEANPVDAGLAQAGLLPKNPLPTVLLVHGGPRARDRYGFSSMNAWLANRGYAVLQVNFRGSTGFGKKHTNAGNGEWGRKMHYDLLDAVQYAIAKGIADRTKIAIMGGSYGGYAALVGLTFTPDVFACGIDIVGPSNLVTLLETIPPYWMGFYKEMTTMLGADKDTPNDQFVNALKRNSIPVTYVLYPDEGHGFRRTENSLAEAGFIEQFLHKCLGGEHQVYKIGMYNSSAQIVADGGNWDAYSLRVSADSFPPQDGFSAPALPLHEYDFYRNMFTKMG